MTFYNLADQELHHWRYELNFMVSSEICIYLSIDPMYINHAMDSPPFLDHFTGRFDVLGYHRHHVTLSDTPKIRRIIKKLGIKELEDSLNYNGTNKYIQDQHNKYLLQCVEMNNKRKVTK